MLIIWSEWYLCAASSWPGAQRGCISYRPKIEFYLRWSWGISGDMGTVPTAVEKALAYQGEQSPLAVHQLPSRHLVGCLYMAQAFRKP